MANRNDPFYQRLQEKFSPVNLICRKNIPSKQVSGIYCIVNKTNKRIYIGSSVSLLVRVSTHLSKLNHNKHHSIFMQRDYNKLGKEAFEFYILEEVIDKTQLIVKEQQYLDSICNKRNCYNSLYIAESRLGAKLSQKTKNKISNSRTGKHLSEETKQKMSKSRTGVPLSATHPIRNGQKEETKKKISNAMLGDKNHFFGKHHSDETRQLIKEQRTGIENYFGPKCAVVATNIKTGEIKTFPSMAQAGRELGVGSGHVSSVCSGKLMQIGGWKFVKETI